jgi:hypothetical protein
VSMEQPLPDTIARALEELADLPVDQRIAGLNQIHDQVKAFLDTPTQG